MRCKGEPQKNNVVALMKTLLPVTQAEHDPGLACDRGYTEEQQLTNQGTAKFSSIGICNDASRNPFLPQDAVDAQTQKWRGSKKMQTPRNPEDPDDERTIFNNDLMDKCMDVFKEWIIDSTERLGSDVRVATKDVKLKGDDDSEYYVTITAYAVCEKFDRKTATKDLLFFSTGTSTRRIVHVWVAVPGDSASSDHLFSDKTASDVQKQVEEKLRLKCRPLTIGQRCADWFLLKLLLSGTNAGIVYNKVK